MATVGEAEVLVRATLDMEAIQMLGWAARAVELAQRDPAAVDTVDTAFNAYIDARDLFEGMDERTALLYLAASCLARLYVIR